MKIELVVGIIGIVIAFGAVGIAGQTMMNVNNQETPAKGFDWRDAPEYWKFVNENFVSEGEWEPHNMELLVKFENLDKKVDSLQGQVTLLQAKGDVVTQPTTSTPPISTIDLLLRVTDHKGIYKPSGYTRDVPAILIQGESTFLEKSYLITIRDPSGQFVKDKFGQTLSDGDISEAWIPNNAIVGEYEITITLDSRKDTIKFRLL